ncbi:hypothetical protein ACQ4LE_010556 [Meloidogyne hapla]|uniref:Uncharacterized protein n=1 Tax=Meloidogyne hapla TaxID=6305 RepID=A0A1I8BC40_MELHA
MQTLTSQFDLLAKSIETLKEEKQQNFISSNTNQNFISAEELERQRSLVLSGLPESTKQLPSERIADDVESIKVVLDQVGVECAPRFIYRMGRSFSNPPNNGQARLLKIVLPSRKFQKEALKLWNKNGGKNKFPNLSMRESLTQEQLQQRRQLMNECKKKRTEILVKIG